MRIFDPHIHMSARTTDDYVAMYESGVRAVVEPSFWLGQPRTSVGSFVDYFDALIGWERFRAAQYGIRHHCTIGLNPKEANDPRCREVLAVLPRYLAKDGVVAVGELGYDSMTPEEEEVFVTQLALARDVGLPAVVHTPHRDKAAGTTRTLDVVRESGIGPERVVVDHLNETTVAEVADSGCWMGFSIYPRHQDGRAPDGRDPARIRHRADARELRRGLGAVRPAEDPQDRPRPCSTRASPSTTSTSCSGRTPSPSTGRADACTSTRCRGSSSTSPSPR